MTDTTNTEPPLLPAPKITHPDAFPFCYYTAAQCEAYGDARAAHAVAQMQGEPVALHRDCGTCAHAALKESQEPCTSCAPHAPSWPNWTPAQTIRELASAQAQQEPVAWMSTVMCLGPNYGKVRFDKLPIQSLQEGYYTHTPLYTAPPVRQAETMTMQEVWQYAGGNPGIEPSREDVIAALRQLDEVCDEAAEREPDGIPPAELTDAERYRWLRDEAAGEIVFDHTRDQRDGGNHFAIYVPFDGREIPDDEASGRALDEAIDAAIAATKKD